jgi:glyoxylase-like metal-dependent hydrolase (beta-lactamase superfamily II)
MKPLITALIATALLPSFALALDPTLETTSLTENIHMLSGQGGNIGVLTGPDGTFVIDDQMAPVVPALLASIKKLGGDDPRFLINTHDHFDHAGGNEAVAATGTTIFSHDNARKRLAEGSTISAFDAHTPAAPEAALPVITYSESMHFHINGDTLRTVHFPHAHTDGDSVIYFEKANILHTGDIFFNGLYPFIDTENGGSLVGVIGAVRKLIATTDDNTKIIPGHGPLASKADLIAYQDMLTFANASMRDLKKEGKSVEEAIAANPLEDYDAHWGGKLFTTEKWIGLLYPSI